MGEAIECTGDVLLNDGSFRVDNETDVGASISGGVPLCTVSEREDGTGTVSSAGGEMVKFINISNFSTFHMDSAFASFTWYTFVIFV